MASALLDMINATPEERAALSKIAMLRAQGIPDDQIYANIGDPSFTQGGGAGYIPYALDAAGISSQYNFGRGNLALQAGDQAYQQFSNPYNSVAAMQYLRDTGDSAMLSDPTLDSVQPGPASVYQQYLKSLFDPSTFPQASAAAGGVAAPGQTPAAPSAANPTAQGWIDAWKAYHPGEEPPVPGYGASATTATQAPQTAQQTGAQQATARLFGQSLGGVGLPQQFRQSLANGQVPGNNQLNERDRSLLSPDQQGTLFSLQASTGRVSDPMAAYRQFASTYGHR